IAALVERPAMGSSSPQCVVLVPEVAEPLDALLEEVLRSRPVALLPDGVGEHEEGEGDAPGGLERAAELERRLGPHPAGPHVSPRRSGPALPSQRDQESAPRGDGEASTPPLRARDVQLRTRGSSPAW